MRLRNNIFAAAFDYLKREKGIKTQKRLAELMCVSEDTITRILKDRTEVTEDIITKLQTASGCIFNLQWLRGEDAFPMLAIDLDKEEENKTVDQFSLILASKDELIAEKDKRIKEKDEMIADLRSRIADKDEIIADLKAKLAEHSILHPDWRFKIGVGEDPNESILPTQK